AMMQAQPFPSLVDFLLQATELRPSSDPLLGRKCLTRFEHSRQRARWLKIASSQCTRREPNRFPTCLPKSEGNGRLPSAKWAKVRAEPLILIASTPTTLTSSCGANQSKNLPAPTVSPTLKKSCATGEFQGSTLLRSSPLSPSSSSTWDRPWNWEGHSFAVSTRNSTLPC